MKRKMFTRISVLIILIFSLNYIANFFHWYSSLWWFDMLMHFLGGFWLGLVMLWIFAPTNMSFRSVLFVFWGALIVGIGWEFFEFFVNENIAQNFFDMRDTASDIFFDLSGAFVSMLYFVQRFMRIS